MRVTELIKVVGKVGKIQSNGFTFDVNILDARSAPGGRIEYEVSPVSGTGKHWMDSSSVQVTFVLEEKNEADQEPSHSGPYSRGSLKAGQES